MMEKLAHAGVGEGTRPTPFTKYTITGYAPAEWADTLTLFSSLPIYSIYFVV
jgi:hypothetical protein